ADAEDLERDAAERALEEVPYVLREVEADAPRARDRDDRAEDAGAQLAEVVDQRHDRLVGRRGGRGRGFGEHGDTRAPQGVGGGPGRVDDDRLAGDGGRVGRWGGRSRLGLARRYDRG